MKEQVVKKLKGLVEKAKEVKGEAEKGISRNSLAESIKSRQQAENLKRLLEGLK